MEPELKFSLLDATPLPDAAVPQIAFRLRIEDISPEPSLIQTAALRCQIRIESTNQQNDESIQSGRHDLFGVPSRWGQMVRSMLWTHAQLIVPSFQGVAEVDLPVPCSFDFNLAATRHFYGSPADFVPLCFLFSGTAFYYRDDLLQSASIPWDRELYFPLPLSHWKEMMELYYPNSVWLQLRSDLFTRLSEFRSQSSSLTWDQAIERLLATATEELEVLS